MQTIYKIVNETVRSHINEAVLHHVKDGGLDSQGKTLMYTDDIIGVNGIDKDGQGQVGTPTVNLIYQSMISYQKR